MRLLKGITGMALLLALATGCFTTVDSVGKQAAQSKAKQPEMDASLQKSGFKVEVVEGRLLVFAEGSEALAKYEETGKEPAKIVVRPLAGPNRMTIMSPDGDTIDAYMLAKPGFKVEVVDGRLLVFAEGSEALAKYEETGKEPAKIVVRPLAGPNRMTIMSPDGDTIDAYMLAKPGFKVEVVDGRLLVFAEGSEELAKYEETGKEPAKIVVRPLAGPNRMTIMSPDGDTIDAYMAK